jgi:phage/plasmid primase-like uncharacterized protein
MLKHLPNTTSLSPLGPKSQGRERCCICERGDHAPFVLQSQQPAAKSAAKEGEREREREREREKRQERERKERRKEEKKERKKKKEKRKESLQGSSPSILVGASSDPDHPAHARQKEGLTAPSG